MSNVIINYPAVGATALALLSLSFSFPPSLSLILSRSFLVLLHSRDLFLSLLTRLALSARAESTTKHLALRGTGFSISTNV